MDLSASLLILIIRYSNILVFWRALLIINRNAIVITAELENPDKASSGVKYPVVNKSVNIIIAVTSMENNSVTKRTKPPNNSAITKIISGVIKILLVI